MGALAHVLEAEGLATVALAQVRSQIERMHPPRVLYAEFPLGRPLGRPGDPDFQHRVLASAFDLLHAEGPTLVDFPEVITDEADTPLSCSLPPRMNDDLPAAVDEVQGLRAAWERTRTATGRSSVGKVIHVEQVGDAVAAFARIADGASWDEADLPVADAQVVHDIRAYYEEAALALADHVPAARASETWFYRDTEAGRTIRAARDALQEAGEPVERWFSLVPMTQ